MNLPPCADSHNFLVNPSYLFYFIGPEIFLILLNLPVCYADIFGLNPKQS